MNKKSKKVKSLLTKTCLDILDSIAWFIAQDGKNYAMPYAETVIRLVEKKHGRKMHRRWYDRCVKRLINFGRLKRQPRYYHNANGEIRQKPSLLSLTFAGVNELIKFGSPIAKKIKNYMIAWLKGKDKRFPRGPSTPPWQPPEIKPEGVKELRALTEIVTSPI
ncbi:hypothetical protein ES708_20827 [subsurface metagenome]